jgi:hypothetical protein
MLGHYGVVALPCRIKDPDRKGKAEAGVAHAQKTPLKGLRTTTRQVAVMFAEEKPALQALPLEPFRYYKYGQRTVNLDGCVEVDAAYYGAPPGWIGRQVDVSGTGSSSASCATGQASFSENTSGSSVDDIAFSRRISQHISQRRLNRS